MEYFDVEKLVKRIGALAYEDSCNGVSGLYNLN